MPRHKTACEKTISQWVGVIIICNISTFALSQELHKDFGWNKNDEQIIMFVSFSLSLFFSSFVQLF